MLKVNMNTSQSLTALIISAALALVLTLAARGEDMRSTAKFSQPDKPGTVRVQMVRGSLNIQGTDDPEVIVQSSQTPVANKTRKDGLRVLTSSSTFSLLEKDNVITLDAMSDGWAGSNSRFNLTVPRYSSIIVQNSWGGEVTCSEIDGDIEVNNMNGSIRLKSISGGVAVSTMNGEIHVSIRELREGRALSLQSMNGEVVVRLPREAKANVRIRTQNGSVLTDFEEKALATKTENIGGALGHRVTTGVGGAGILTPQARDAIREAARVGAEAVKDAAIAIREAAEAAREGAEDSRNQSARATQSPTPPRPPRLPKAVTIPTITGGKLVTGFLNGGGVEISVATMNGDVTIRQLEQN